MWIECHYHTFHRLQISFNIHVYALLALMKICPSAKTVYIFLCWKLAVSSWVYEIPYWNYQKRRFSLPHNSKFEVKSSVYLHANLCCHPPCFTHIDHSSVQSSYPAFNFHPPALCAVCNVHQISCTCGPR